MSGLPDGFMHRGHPLSGFAPLQSRPSTWRVDREDLPVRPTLRFLPEGNSRGCQDPSPVPRGTSPLRFSRPSSAISDASPFVAAAPRRAL